MFEYKVKCRHKLGWKEIKLYGDSDIEEFFNRNSIDYVRNMTDTVEHRQLKEIERLINLNKQLVEECQRLDDEETRLNNIINEIERLIINHNYDTGDIYYKYNGKYIKSELKERIMELVELKEEK